MSVPTGPMPGDLRLKRLRGKRILVAESEGATLMVLQAALRREGAHIVAVCHSAVEIIHIASEENLDLILVELPPHRTPEVVSVIRQLSRDERVCVVIMTAVMSKHDEEHLRAAGAAGFVHKPFTVAQLLPLMEETCDTRWSAA